MPDEFALMWNINLVKQKRMLEESERMITDTDKRLGAAVQELGDLIVSSTPPRSPFPSLFTAFSLSSLQIQAKADPALADAQELLSAEEEMGSVTL